MEIKRQARYWSDNPAMTKLVEGLKPFLLSSRNKPLTYGEKLKKAGLVKISLNLSRKA